MWLFFKSIHLVHPCTPHHGGTPLENSGTPWGVQYTLLTSTGLKRFVSIHLHCIIRNLKRIGKMSTLPPPGKISADAHGARLNGGVQREYRNLLSHSTITSWTCILLQIRALCIRVTMIRYTSFDDKVFTCLHNSSLRLIRHYFLIPLRWRIRQILLYLAAVCMTYLK